MRGKKKEKRGDTEKEEREDLEEVFNRRQEPFSTGYHQGCLLAASILPPAAVSPQLRACRHVCCGIFRGRLGLCSDVELVRVGIPHLVQVLHAGLLHQLQASLVTVMIIVTMFQKIVGICLCHAQCDSQIACSVYRRG
jgi:hypothetical protein